MALNDYTHTQWHKLGITARLGLGVTSLDARVFMFIILWFFYPSFLTLYLIIGMIVLFRVLEYFGFSIQVGLRRMRRNLAGKRRIVHNFYLRRRRFNNG